MTPTLEKMYRAMGQELPTIKRILELKPGYPLVAGLRAAHVRTIRRSPTRPGCWPGWRCSPRAGSRPTLPASCRCWPAAWRALSDRVDAPPVIAAGRTPALPTGR
jgi:hypothetical protein